MTTPNVRIAHDSFFKQVFSRKETARSFLQEFLPAEVVACLDLETLDAMKDSFVDDELNASFSDLCYTVRTIAGDYVVIHLLFEHKSFADPLSAFQMLKYVVRINEHRLRDGLPLCCVIPLLIYHGAERWNVPRDYQSLVNTPDATKHFLPQFAFQLYDLSQFDDNDIRGTLFLRAAMLSLKYVYRPEMADRLSDILGLLVAIANEPVSVECIRLVLLYIGRASPTVSVEQLKRVVENTVEITGKSIMPTIAETLSAEARIQGRQEGRQEGYEKGEVVGKIRLCQKFLGEAVTSKETLDNLTVIELASIFTELEGRLSR